MTERSASTLVPLDVAVFGGGPAGCAAAIALRQGGRRVTILESRSTPAFKVGEHLRPEAVAELGHLGLLGDGPAHYLQESPGIRVVWGSAEIRERDYLFDHRGRGWNVSRRELECRLIHSARESGVDVLAPASELHVERDTETSWRIDANVDGQRMCLYAQWLIDATGRRAWVARRMGATRQPLDRMVALVGRLNTASETPDADRLFVEAAPDGWWYSVGLPDGSLIAVYLTDSDHLEPHRPAGTVWTEALAQTEHTRMRTQDATLAGPVSVHAAQSAFLTPTWGTGWIAVGDAAWSSDPLAGIGVSEAVLSARSAALAVDAACDGDDKGRLADHADALNSRIDTVLTQLLDAYRSELRWIDRPFWKRHQVAPQRIAPIRILPDSLIRIPGGPRRPPAVGLAREHLDILLALATTPRSAASVLREFITRCPVDELVALRALQAVAEVVAPSPERSSASH